MRTLALVMLAAVSLAGAQTDLEKRLASAGDNEGEIRGFVAAAAEAHGAFGKRAAVFLVEGMPESDLRSLKKEFLMENLKLAIAARGRFPWAKAVPEEIFLNDVLPYASLDETREPWRKGFYEQCQALVKESKSTTDAAQTINREFFKAIKVHYNTGRKAPNQSPSESMKLGMATCTGLSIIMVDACRSVGVPARVVGTPQWSNKRGNHTWVEVYDDGMWHYTGADEYNKEGLNRGWFGGDASKAIADDWRHAIWASSWRKADGHFPMVWSLRDRSVAGVNVTARYAKPSAKKVKKSTVNLRIWDKQGGKRLAVLVELFDSAGKKLQAATTKTGGADLNDMVAFSVKAGADYLLRIIRDRESREVPLRLEKTGEVTKDLMWDELQAESASVAAVRNWLALPPEERQGSVPEGGFSKNDAAQVQRLIWETVRKERGEQSRSELDAKVVKAAGKEMKYLEKSFGKAEEGQRSLFISMHGGGGAPPRVNEQQWNNQIRLYAPKEGIVVAPRAPTDTWNLWHEGHIDALFDRLIANFVLERGVSPDRIYLMGYSAGGDGVYQLAPRMADRFAAASMMAGHPNNASPLGLRNLPFMIFMGGKDGAYQRNETAADWGKKLAKLKLEDAAGYEHKVTIYEGLGHWMNGKDVESLPWMAGRTRNPWPKKVVWHQSGRTHDRFYWLAVPKGTAKGGQIVRAEVAGQKIAVEAKGLSQLTLRLSDKLLNLDEPVAVTVNGEEVFNGLVARKVQVMWDSLSQRPDYQSMSTGLIELKF